MHETAAKITSTSALKPHSLKRIHRGLRTSLVASMLALSACSNSTNEATDSPLATQEQASESQVAKQASIATPNAQNLAILTQVQASFKQSRASAQTLTESTRVYTASPSAEAHTALLDLFKLAHQDYRVALATTHISTQALLSAHMIDDAPLLNGYLDSVEGYPHSGLINSELPLTAESLAREYQFSDPLYLTLGFHPYAFILAGDPSHPVAAWRRFADEGTDKQKNAAQRRRDYLVVLAEQIQAKISEQHDFLSSLQALDISQLKDDAFWETYIAAEKERSGQETSEKIKHLITELRALAKDQTNDVSAKSES